MRIKNVGQCTIIFKGGILEAGKVAVFKGDSEKIGAALLKAYPRNLSNLDEIKPEEVVNVVIEAPKAEELVKPVKKVAPRKKVSKKK